MTLTATTAAAAAGVGLAPTSGHAASITDIEKQVSALNAQAEQATNVYDGAMEQLANLQKQVDNLQGEAATMQQSMNQVMATLGPLAAASYRAGSVDPTLELMLQSHPDQFLQQAATMSQLGQAEAMNLKTLKLEQAQLASIKKQAADRLAQLQQAEHQAADMKAQIVDKFQQAQSLLSQLTYTQLASFDYSGVSAAEIAAVPPATGRAAIAIAFAKSKLGTWYLWGGTGPQYDCSGLVQAAWAAAGVSLPRTTYEQVNVGYAVPAILGDLEPGDVIFYNGDEHEALYIGGGLVIHAPTTGMQVQYGHWNMMSISGIQRMT
ncbi:MAG TPA: NlpC/P60 family protein [Actinocrinis sp.]|uniref:C40 family peptidase n=1 Tax=Actinocrinis sp. TaxID=1920516 RepID=UPI002DDD6283|nr:NlpC/P60 family protein [Actinocrinis sp.]HEV2343109.1 NlpC/P60 family protein [Actinocrinis sp.]